MIEVNSQVSFNPTGEFITCAKTDGYSFDDIINYIVEKASDITGTDRRLAFSEILDTGYHLFANGTLSGTYLESMYFKVVFSSYSLFMSSLLMPYRAIECLRSCFRRKGS